MPTRPGVAGTVQGPVFDVSLSGLVDMDGAAVTPAAPSNDREGLEGCFNDALEAIFRIAAAAFIPARIGLAD